MPRPRAQDPITSFTLSLPLSAIQRLETLNATRVRQGYASVSTMRLVRELLLSALPTYEAAHGYAWTPQPLAVAPRKAPRDLPPVGHYQPIAGNPALPPPAPPLVGPSLAELASAPPPDLDLNAFFDQGSNQS